MVANPAARASCRAAPARTEPLLTERELANRTQLAIHATNRERADAR